MAVEATAASNSPSHWTFQAGTTQQLDGLSASCGMAVFDGGQEQWFQNTLVLGGMVQINVCILMIAQCDSNVFDDLSITRIMETIGCLIRT